MPFESIIRPLRAAVFAVLLTAAMAIQAAPPNGQDIAFSSNKGNCLGCHVIAGGSQMGDIGPPLEKMRERFPDRARLREQIWDASRFKPSSLMPPFGRFKILNDDEIDAVVSFLYSL